MHIKIKLRPFQLPNFVMTEQPARPRQEGINFDSRPFGCELSELDAETLAGLCDEFRAGVFAKAGKEDPDKKTTDFSNQ